MDEYVPRRMIRRKLLAGWFLSAVALLALTGAVFSVLLYRAGEERVRDDMVRALGEVAQRLDDHHGRVGRAAILMAERRDVIAALHLLNTYETPEGADSLIFNPEKARLARQTRDDVRSTDIDAAAVYGIDGGLAAFFVSGRASGSAPVAGYSVWENQRRVLMPIDGMELNSGSSHFGGGQLLALIPDGSEGPRRDLKVPIFEGIGLAARVPVVHQSAEGDAGVRLGAVIAASYFARGEIDDILARAGMEAEILPPAAAAPLGDKVAVLGSSGVAAGDVAQHLIEEAGHLRLPVRLEMDSGGDVVLMLSAPKPVLGGVLSTFGEASALALVAVLLLILPLGALGLQRLVIRPLEELARAAEAVRHGRASGVRLAERQDELGTVALAFNEMIASLIARESELRDSRRQYRDLYDYAPVAYATVEVRDGTVQRFNKAFLALTGLHAEAAQGITFTRLFRSEAGQTEGEGLRDRLRQGAVVRDHELRLRRADGADIWVGLGAEPVRDAAGVITEARVAIIDIDDRKRAERDLRHAVDELTRANVELSQFAQVAAHDLREPVRRIVTYAQLLERSEDGTLTTEQRDFLGFISIGARRIYDLVGALLEYAETGGQAVRLGPVDVAGVLDTVREHLEQSLEESGGRLDIGPMPVILANQMQMLQVFQNLVSNALKFQHPDRPPQVAVTARPDGGAKAGGVEGWLFTVRDNGIGFDPALTDRVFEMFQRLHPNQGYPGTGIGLPICRKIIEGAGGRIWAESTPGEGSAFFFFWPDHPVTGRSGPQTTGAPARSGPERGRLERASG